MTICVRSLFHYRGQHHNQSLFNSLTCWQRDKLSLSMAHLVLKAVLLSSVRMSRACSSYKLCSMFPSLGSPTCSAGPAGSAGVPGCETLALWGEVNDSRWINACLEALRLISRNPAKSPLLKLPLPCLNSHKAESGCPV